MHHERPAPRHPAVRPAASSRRMEPELGAVLPARPGLDREPSWTMGIKPMLAGVLDPKTVEFIAIAVDASCTHMYAPGVRRHIRKALDLGATQEEIAAVLQLISVLGIHTMSLGAPILQEELAARADTASTRPAEHPEPPRRPTMQFLDDSLLPENQQPLVIQVAPYGPEFLPGDSDDIPVTMAEQVQKAVDCWNAGATVLHVHCREADGQGSKRHVDVQRDAGPAARSGAEDAAAGRRLDLLRARRRGRRCQVAERRHAPHAGRAEPEARPGDDRDQHQPDERLRADDAPTTWPAPRWRCRRTRRPTAR